MKKIIMLLITFLLAALSGCTDDKNPKNEIITSPPTEASSISQLVISDETTSIASITTASNAEEAEVSQSLSENGFLKIVDVDRSDFSEKTIKYEDRLILDDNGEGNYAKRLVATDRYLMVTVRINEQQVIYRYNIDTFEFIDVLEPPKPKKIPNEENYELKAYNNITLCQDNIIVAQPYKTIIYDMNFIKKAEYDMNPDSEYVKNCYFVHTDGIDETHIIYQEQFILDLTTGEEVELDLRLKDNVNAYGYRMFEPVGDKIFMCAAADGEGIINVYTVNDFNGRLIDYSYEKNLIENKAVISTLDNTIYRFPKDDYKIKLAIQTMSANNSGHTRLAVENGMFNCDPENKIYDLKNKVSYAFEFEAHADGVKEIVDSYTYNGKTYLLLKTYDKFAPCFVVVV